MGNGFNCCRKQPQKEDFLLNGGGKASFDHSVSDLERTQSFQLDTAKTYPLWVAICFVLNYGIGSGILGLPKEYAKAGLVLGTILLLWTGWLAYCTYLWIVDAMIRARAIKHLAKESEVIGDFATHPHSVLEQLAGASKESLQAHYALDHIEYELNELIGIFCGKYYRIIYEVLFTIAMVMELCSYCTLFGVSMTRHIGIDPISKACDITQPHTSECRGLYSFYIGIFWLWSMFITIQDFPAQAGYQTFSSIMRFIIIFVMLFTAIGLMYSGWSYNGQTFEQYTGSSPHYGEGVAAFQWAKTLSFFGIAGFAYGNQFCTSDVLAPLRPEDRHKQKTLWGVSLIISGLAFILCGFVIAFYFGDNSESPCTLAWNHFRGFKYITGTRPTWATVLSLFIVLFPAFDMLSTYPLNAISTANTMEAAFLSEEKRRSKFWKYFVRIAICTITSIFALFVWNFDIIVSATGAFLIISLYGGSALLEYYSKKTCQELTKSNDAHVTEITDTKIVSANYMVIACGVTAVIAFIGVFVDFLID